MTAIYPGSFNPFTKGHLDILARALRVFDRVVLAVGFNERKPGSRDEAAGNAEILRKLFADVERVDVISYSGLTIEAAREAGASTIIRGVRNAADADYERSLAATNLMISADAIDTWLIPARPELECVSSSMVRELSHFGHPVLDFLPSPEECRKACG